MTERDLLAAVREACKWYRLAHFHTHDSRRSEPGFPDCVIAGSYGVLFRELKSERGRLSGEQQRWQEVLAEAGADVGVWTPRDWPTRIVAELAGIGGRLSRQTT